MVLTPSGTKFTIKVHVFYYEASAELEHCGIVSFDSELELTNERNWNFPLLSPRFDFSINKSA
jgi:hypothetical protein